MKRLVFALLCFCSLPAAASHIVGGEFELIYKSKNQYTLRLLYYFDVLNNGFGGVPPEQNEPFITAAIFRKSDNALMRYVDLDFISRTPVNYTQPECSNGEIVTEKLIYSASLYMSDEEFGDPQGYYVIWERCCRNYTINNIVSDPPPIGGDPNFPDAAGQTFYLHFPPVVKNGVEFVNSSPRLFPPLNDYGCPNKPYYADFSGTDDDDDSLVYTMVEPLSTHTSEAEPPLLPEPFPVVKWQPPFSFNNIMGGDPDLKISKEGILTVTPKVQGLFVFAVRCEEFRHGVKIGEVRRDFQMLVVDGCAPAKAPVVKGRRLGEPSFNFRDNMTVTFSNTVTDANRCIEIEVTDEDVFTDQSERIKIRAIPLGWKGKVTNVLPVITTGELNATNTSQVFQICFDECPYFENGLFQIGIIAGDDACALPLLDTLRLNVYVQPPFNSPAQFTTSNVSEEVLEGQSDTWAIHGFDADGDVITKQVITDGFIFNDRGFFFENESLSTDEYSAQLRWDAFCDQYDFSDRSNFEMKIVIDDQDLCQFNEADTMTVDLNVLLPVDTPPVIGSNIVYNGGDDQVDWLERRIFETARFTVFGTDQDNNPLTLEMFPQGFEATTYGMTFPTATANNAVSSIFNWNVLCENINLEERDEFDFLFVVRDSPNRCNIYRADSMEVKIKLLPAINSAPSLTVTNLIGDVPFADNEVKLTMGQQLSLQITGTDPDSNPPDHLVLDLVGVGGDYPPEGMQFARVEGTGSVQTALTWKPDCSIFQNGVYENNYYFRFGLRDDRCENIKGDTLEVKLNIKDVDGSDTHFLPPNFVSPNGDGCNDFFGMEEMDVTACGVTNIPNLPKDNCYGRFSSISIYNRWGKEVFTSTNRNFKWHPVSEAPGVYYYTLHYTHTEYKGSVTVMN